VDILRGWESGLWCAGGDGWGRRGRDALIRLVMVIFYFLSAPTTTSLLYFEAWRPLGARGSEEQTVLILAAHAAKSGVESSTLVLKFQLILVTPRPQRTPLRLHCG
jgi:hypothetical protein